MKLGLIGLQNSGKTTIFNALTNMNAEVTAYASTKVEPNLAVIDVLDERIDKFTEMYNPKKSIYANIELIDFIGLTSGSAKDGMFSSSAMNLIRNTDALALVIRNYEDDLMGERTPIDDISSLVDEMVLSDLIVAEKRVEKIALDIKRGRKTPELMIELKAVEKLSEALNDGKPSSIVELSADEEKAIRGFQFLSRKPILIILNSDEDSFGKHQDTINQIEKENYNCIEFAGKFEMELSGLDEDEAEMFMEDLGISESAKERLTQFAYRMLGLISFFTVGKDEVRAWTIHEGDNAVDAAGAIHSDLARGFIRAECFTYQDLMDAGSEKGIKEKGLFRLEGKTYIVKDGDILNIRFNV